MQDISGEDSKKQFGRWAEEAVARELVQRRMTILEHNYMDGYGHEELDLVAEEGRALIVVEVRSRRFADPDDVLESVTPKKVQHVRALAERYFLAHCDPERYDEIRFFLAGVCVSDHDQQVVVIFPDAF